MASALEWFAREVPELRRGHARARALSLTSTPKVGPHQAPLLFADRRHRRPHKEKGL